MTFKDDLLADPVGSLNLRNAIAVDRHTVLRASIAMMRSQSLGCAVIVDQLCHPTGVFTERSVINATVAGAGLDDHPVSEFADPAFFVVQASDPILTLWKAVVGSGARFVCVTDDGGRLVGLAGQRSLAEYVCDSFAGQVTVQRLGSRPWMVNREGA